jgi:hypothetical protein
MLNTEKGRYRAALYTGFPMLCGGGADMADRAYGYMAALYIGSPILKGTDEYRRQIGPMGRGLSCIQGPYIVGDGRV